MAVALAWLNLVHEKFRTLVAVSGVSFAVILILMQAGFFSAVLQTATLAYDRFEFDVLLVSPNYLHIGKPSWFPRRRLAQAASCAEVAKVTPFNMAFTLWLNPDEKKRNGIMVMSINPQDEVFNLPDIKNQQARLNESQTMLLDRLSHADFSPREVGDVVQVGQARLRLVGLFTLGTGFSANGAILVSDRTYDRLFPHRAADSVTMGFVKLKDPARAEQAAEHLRAILPPDVNVYTRQQMNSRERWHWVAKTSVGIIFGLGVAVAFFVGIAIVSQVLSSDVARRLPEYATLKAMGYGAAFLRRVVLSQALILAAGGFALGLVVSAALYDVTSSKAQIPMHLSAPLVLGTLVGDVVMCCLAGWLSLRKLEAADPADLF